MPTLTTLASLNGATTDVGLVADAAGDLFGTTTNGGAYGDGSVFELADTNGSYASTVTTLVSFNGADGSDPATGVTLDANGDLLGATESGGSGGAGTLFEVPLTSGSYSSTPTTLTNFTVPAGSTGEVAYETSLANNALAVDSAGDVFGSFYTKAPGPTVATPSFFELPDNNGSYATAPITLAAGASIGNAATLAVDSMGDLFGFSIGSGEIFEIPKSATGYASTPVVLKSAVTGGVPNEPYFLDGGLTVDAAGNVFGFYNQYFDETLPPIFEIAKTATGYGPMTDISNFPPGNPPTSLIEDAQGNLFFTEGYSVAEVAKTGSSYAALPTTIATLGSNPFSSIEPRLGRKPRRHAVWHNQRLGVRTH